MPLFISRMILNYHLTSGIDERGERTMTPSRRALLVMTVLSIMLVITACIPDLLLPETPDEAGRSITDFKDQTFESADSEADRIYTNGESIKRFKVIVEGETSLEATRMKYSVSEWNIVDIEGYSYIITIPDDNTIILTAADTADQYSFRRVT